MNEKFYKIVPAINSKQSSAISSKTLSCKKLYSHRVNTISEYNSGPTASTSKQTGDMSGAIAHNTSAQHIPLQLCAVHHNVPSQSTSERSLHHIA